MNNSITIYKFKKEYESGVYKPPIFTTIDEYNNVLPLEAHYKFITPNINKNLMKYVIGKKGCRFNEITESSGVKYIWYKKDENIIEIWGDPKKLDSAIQMINDEIDFVKFKFNLNLNLNIKNNFNNIHSISNFHIIL